MPISRKLRPCAAYVRMRRAISSTSRSMVAAENPRLGSRNASRKKAAAPSNPAASRVWRAACEPGQSGSVMVTSVRPARAKISSVSAADRVKNPSRMTFAGRTAGAALLRRAWRKPRPRALRFRSTSSSRPARSAGRAAGTDACSNKLRQRAAKTGESGYRGKTLRPQPLQRLLDQQVQQRRGSRRLGGPVFETVRQRADLSRPNGESGAGSANGGCVPPWWPSGQ